MPEQDEVGRALASARANIEAIIRMLNGPPPPGKPAPTPKRKGSLRLAVDNERRAA
jgi:hypothetical protein